MNDLSSDLDENMILARLDKTTPENLLISLAKEFVLLHQHCVSLEARINAFEVTQTLYDQIAASVTVMPQPVLPRSVTIDSAFSLSAESGFHLLEYDIAGTPFRWTGSAPTFYFEVMFDRSSPAHLRLKYIKSYADLSGKNLQCYVDGEEITVNQISVGDGFEIRGVIPRREFFGGTVLMFNCPVMASPAQIELSNDDRKLGIAFRSLRIECDNEISTEPVLESEAAVTVIGDASPDSKSEREKTRRPVKTVSSAVSVEDVQNAEV